MIKQTLRRGWYTFFAAHPLSYPARFILWTMSSKHRSEYLGGFLSGNEKRWPRLDKMIRKEVCRQYYSKPDGEIRKLNREKFWGASTGKQWHQAKRESYNDPGRFLKIRGILVSQLSELLSEDSSYDTIIEIGTGNGMFIQHLSKKFPDVKNFIGIDLNEEQILENKATYKDSNIHFVHDEVTDWVRKNDIQNSIFVSCGTFEYFTQTELQELLEFIQNTSRPSAFAICEPVNIDLSRELVSQPRGNIAFSHNYPYLFRCHHYGVFRQNVVQIRSDVPFYNNVIMVSRSQFVPEMTRSITQKQCCLDATT